MSTRQRLISRGTWRTLDDILTTGPRTAWEQARLTRAIKRSKDVKVQLRAQRHNNRRNYLSEG